uniref:DDE Tnp4 domain-containing protein n=1 Tax=Heligmosomoides polygyrus TaxID=6339 RepID=A0A183FBI7_HELPZ
LWGYPRGVGSIDGKHFRFHAPRNSGSSFFNFKGYFSFVLLALVDGAYRILLLDIGGKGRNSDSGLFRSSPMRKFLERSVENFPRGGDLGGHGYVDYHVLADGGFAQTVWMQRPFRQAEAAQDISKAHFNECFSSARRIVESVFGIICSRFRIFQRPLIGTEEHCTLIVSAALVLHNLLVDRIPSRQLLVRYTPTIEHGLREPVSRAQGRVEAQEQRMRLVEYFARRDGLK